MLHKAAIALTPGQKTRMVTCRWCSGNAVLELRGVSNTSPDDAVRSLGRRVAEARRAGGWTQEQVAERAGFSIKYLQRIEGGRENLTIKSLVELAALLEIEVAAFFVWNDEPPID